MNKISSNPWFSFARTISWSTFSLSAFEAFSINKAQFAWNMTWWSLGSVHGVNVECWIVVDHIDWSHYSRGVEVWSDDHSTTRAQLPLLWIMMYENKLFVTLTGWYVHTHFATQEHILYLLLQKNLIHLSCFEYLDHSFVSARPQSTCSYSSQDIMVTNYL